MWTRWNLAFDWKDPVVCANYRYGSVLTSLNHSTSSQSQAQLASVSRSTALFSSRVYLSSSSGCTLSAHATLPGYVFSSSDIESLPPSIPEEPEDSAAKQVDDISLKESSPVTNMAAANTATAITTTAATTTSVTGAANASVYASRAEDIEESL